MNLKKTDKMIAVVGVIIVLLAIVAIAYYVTNMEEEEPEEEEPDFYTYDVQWEFNNKTMTVEGNAGKDGAYEETIEISAPKDSILTAVNVKINWNDDKTYGLFNKNKGEDTLKTTVSADGGSEKELSSTGKGTDDVLSFIINSIPSDDLIDAEDYEEAESEVMDEYCDMSDATLDAKVSWTKGEKILRPLKYISDKGNDFELEIEYEYYTYSIEEMEMEDDDDMEDTSITTNYDRMVSTNCPRLWI